MARFFSSVSRLPVFIGVIGLLNPAQAAEPRPNGGLTEMQSVNIALARPVVQALSESRIALAKSELVEAGRWPNPEFEYEREDEDRGSVDSTEESYWISQRFDLSGQRGLRKKAAKQRLEATMLRTNQDRMEIEANVRTRFLEVLHQQERIAATKRWLGHMSTIEAMVRKRQAAGDISGYDALRLARERTSAEAALRRERARYMRLWAQFSSLLGGDNALDQYEGVVGRLLPESLAPLDTLLNAASRRPDIERLAREADAHDLEKRAGERGWVPELTLGLGRKVIDDEIGRDSGPMISAGITIPLFDRGQSDQQRAAAKAAIARNDYLLSLSAARGEIRGLWHEVSELTQAARDQRRNVREETARLIEIAEAAYRGGELGVLELLDAYRSAHDAQIQSLEIAAAARRSRIALDRLTGGSIL